MRNKTNDETKKKMITTPAPDCNGNHLFFIKPKYKFCKNHIQIL